MKFLLGYVLLRDNIKLNNVILNEKEFIGMGSHRKCYIHPEDDSLCVKILHDNSKAAKKQLSREIKYNEKLKGHNIPILPKYYGKISTNMGQGYVFEFVKNVGGGTSKSLLNYLTSDILLRDNFDGLVDALKRLKADMLFYKIITMAFYPQNILYKKDENGFGRFIIIDDIGSAALIPIEYYFSFAARARINRKWERFLNHIKIKYCGELVNRLVKQVSANDETIVLSDEYFIGKGSHKQCFIHPKNNRLCIKLPYNKDGEKDVKRELKYFNLLKERGVDCDILPKYYGSVSTNIGVGYVFDLIKDYNGQVPQNLNDYLSSDILLEANFSILVNELKILKAKMLLCEIITMGIFPINILCKKNSENLYSFILINDMGSAALIPIEYYFSFAAHNRVNRKWEKFVKYLAKKYSNSLVQELVKQIR
ncbi:MAG: hypothetical protein LBJ88_05180 [Campylobacteraceae bacterium]|nr:hypothetical protein [Campylobacteraceae bacterium]